MNQTINQYIKDGDDDIQRSLKRPKYQDKLYDKTDINTKGSQDHHITDSNSLNKKSNPLLAIK